MKVVFVGGTCDFCRTVVEKWPHRADFREHTELVRGRAYTVIQQFEAKIPWPPFKGIGYLLAEYTMPPGWGCCSCQFRPIDGDSEEWQRTTEKYKPKTRELEPA